MEKLTLSASQRVVLGKKVKKLRGQGLIPANIYGKGLPSTAVAVREKPFHQALHRAGETGVIYMEIEGEDGPRPVLIHSIQRHPVTDNTVHIDFYQVNLKEKTSANVPILLVGENELEKRGEAVIIQTRSEVEVEALPTDIPREFSIDVSTLSEIGQSVKVSDLSYDREKIEVVADPEENILVVQPAAMPEEPEEEVVAEGAEEGAEPVVISEQEAAERTEEAKEEGS